MKNKLFLSIFGVFILATAFSQNNPNDTFEVFANARHASFVQAYQQKNIDLYLQQLDEFQAKFNALSPAEKKRYAQYQQNAYYNLCCTYSLLNNKTKALEYLQKSVDAGYYNYTHIQADPDLDNIRTDEQFIKIISGIRAVGDYKYILKNAGKYNTQDFRALPAFRYQQASDSNLIALRSGFNFDSVAGQGNDVSKMIHLMQWVHNSIPHDGNHPNPQIKNAMSMMATCKKEKRGLNCRGLAIVLNECYLAMGFKSRFVTCLPKDSLQTDPDCHVINMVFAESLKKWIWMDPTNNAYVMNEKGELLGIAEVRQRLIGNEPLIVNPDANWNRKVSKTKEDYLFQYMAKNLYMLECGVSSEYDAESAGPNKTISYITLVPLDYFLQKQQVEESKNDKTHTLYKFYQTNNPNRFWQLPIGE